MSCENEKSWDKPKKKCSLNPEDSDKENISPIKVCIIKKGTPKKQVGVSKLKKAFDTYDKLSAVLCIEMVDFCLEDPN